MTMLKYKDYQGTNIAIQVLELMDEIKRKNPLLLFSAGSNRSIVLGDNNERVEIKMSMVVAEVGDPSKPVGSIGYGSDEKYWVRSRLIQNEKYGQWNRNQFESRYSKHMKNVVKEAIKSLKPVSYEEVFAEYEGSMDRIISDKSRQTRYKAAQKIEVKFDDLFPELLHMSNIGYTPLIPKMAQAIAYAVENKEELEKYYNYTPKKCMIWVRPNSVVYEIDRVVNQVNTTAELPEELRGKLFVLDVTDKGQFVEDVGIKQDTGIYWVLL